MICYLWSAGGEIVYNAISNAKNDELGQGENSIFSFLGSSAYCKCNTQKNALTIMAP
jgi:hypothetical protein